MSVCYLAVHLVVLALVEGLAAGGAHEVVWVVVVAESGDAAARRDLLPAVAAVVAELVDVALGTEKLVILRTSGGMWPRRGMNGAWRVRGLPTSAMHPQSPRPAEPTARARSGTAEGSQRTG